MKSDVTVRRPSRVSKVRVLRGRSRRATTRVRRVADWMAGQLEGSRRSRRSWLLSVFVVGLYVRGAWTYVHVDFSGEKGARWGVEEEDSLDQVQGGDYQEVVLAVCVAVRVLA